MDIKQAYLSVLSVTQLHIEKVLQIFQLLFFRLWTHIRNNTPILPYNQTKMSLDLSRAANGNTEMWKNYLNSLVVSDKHLIFEAIIKSKIWFQNLKMRIMDSSTERYQQVIQWETIWISLDMSKMTKFYTALKLWINLKTQKLTKNWKSSIQPLNNLIVKFRQQIKWANKLRN